MDLPAAVELTPERWAALLAYCRLEPDDLSPNDTAELEGMFYAAVAYMSGSGVSEPDKTSSRRYLYDLCVKSMVLDAWDRRGATVNDRGGYTARENPQFRQMLNQLKMHRPDVSNLNTSGGGGP